FESLAKSLPLLYLGKHKDQLELIEAMLFGQAGLIPDNPSDNYSKKLYSDYHHLATKFNLKAINKSLWKFMRMRPGNFPSIRIGQFAHLIFKSTSLLSKILDITKPEELIKYFDVEASEYWNTHYIFGKETGFKNKTMGSSSINNIVINTIAPFLFFYGKYHKKDEFTELSVEYLQHLSYEKNSIVNSWQKLGVEAKNAFDSQALIQLKNIYCKHRKCLNCRIGNQVIQHKF
ncbi:MAG: DUF2851 family protein, partial [Salinivirgaceae bacterium]|nr:DUF2851 family protein [Salinivirgaceae bacterium]